MIKRIALSGSGGTGKSTLAQALVDKLGWARSTEGVREYLSENNIGALRELTPQSTMKMQWEILNKKIDTEKHLGQFVADRSTVDSVAYALRWCAWDIPDDEMTGYVRAAFTHAYNYYDMVILLPWGAIELEDDGVRSAKGYYQYGIDATIRGLLSKWQVPHYVLRTIDLSNRVDECLQLLNKRRVYIDQQGLVSSSSSRISLST